MIRDVCTLVAGAHSGAFLSPGLLRRAAELDSRHADLDLGLVDCSVMAYAERHELAILTPSTSATSATSGRRSRGAIRGGWPSTSAG